MPAEWHYKLHTVKMVIEGQIWGQMKWELDGDVTYICHISYGWSKYMLMYNP